MKLRTEILLVFLMVGASIIVVTGLLYFYNARNIILNSAGNHLESLSSAKKHRIESIIRKKEEELRLVQNRFFNTEHLYQLNTYGKLNDALSVNYKMLISKNIGKLTKEIPSFRNIHVLNKDGVVVASTDPGAINFNFSILDFVQKALKGENHINSFIDEKNKDAYLCLAGPIYHHNKLQGGVLIETTTSDLATITGDYTGLGITGETVIAQLVSDSVACFITPTRDKTSKIHIIKRSRRSPQAMFLALAGNENLYYNVKDYSGQSVAISCRYISATKWGIVTKMDMEEVLAPAKEFKWMSLKIGAGSLIILFIISLIMATSIVKPINIISDTARKISEGDWNNTVKIDSTNELGDLANSFNKMTRTLIDTQEKLEQKINELDKSNNSLEKFAFVVSHDLKSPLNTVLSIAELIETGHMGTLHADGREMLVILRRKVIHMKEMIGGILEFARIGNQLSDSELVDLKSLLLTMAENCKDAAHVEILNELPMLHMNPIVAEQLFQNLFANAIKYNKSVFKQIQVGSISQDAELVYFVRDNGMGIPQHYISKIFDIFQTVAPKGTDSTGIGLAIVKKIVENYGGRIWIESKIDEGSTFYFTLPNA